MHLSDKSQLKVLQIPDLSSNIENLPIAIRSELERAQEKGPLSVISIPNGDLTFRMEDMLYLNAAHSSFNELINKLQSFSPEILRAYVLGLTQESIQALLE